MHNAALSPSACMNHICKHAKCELLNKTRFFEVHSLCTSHSFRSLNQKLFAAFELDHKSQTYTYRGLRCTYLKVSKGKKKRYNIIISVVRTWNPWSPRSMLLQTCWRLTPFAILRAQVLGKRGFPLVIAALPSSKSELRCQRNLPPEGSGVMVATHQVGIMTALQELSLTKSWYLKSRDSLWHCTDCYYYFNILVLRISSRNPGMQFRGICD